MANFCKTFLLLSASLMSTQAKVNITIMVPGIQAFNKLVEITEKYLSMDLMELESDYVVDQLTTSTTDNYYSYYYPSEASSDIITDDEYYHYGALSTVTQELSMMKDIQQCAKNSSDFSVVCGCVVRYFRFYDWSYVFIKPALELAWEEITNSTEVLPGINVKLQYRDSAGEYGEASSGVSQIEFVEAKMEDQMAATIGPMDSYSISKIVHFSTHWDILHLSPGAISAGINLLRKSSPNEKQVMTFVRTGPVAYEVGRCMAKVLPYYGWERTCVEVFEDDIKERMHYFIAEGIYEGIFDTDSNYESNQIRLSEFPNKNSTYTYMYDEILLSLSTMGRIVVLSAADNIVREFLKKAEEFGYSNEEYAYIIVDLEGRLGTTPWVWVDPNGITHNDSDIREAMEAALIVTIRTPETKQYEEFVNQIIERLESFGGDSEKFSKAAKIVAEMEMSNFGAESLHQFFTKNQYPSYYYDSLWMVANVLTEKLREVNGTEDDIHEFSGKDLVQYMKNAKFNGIGGHLAMNKDGDRKTDFSVWDLNSESGKFEVIGEFDSVASIYYELSGKHAEWPGGKPPLDIPVCGFTGRKCAKKSLTLIEGVVISIVALATVIAIVSIIGYRKHKLRKELQSQLWRVLWNDITWLGDAESAGNFGTDMRISSPNGRRMGLAGSDLSLAEVISFIMPSPAFHEKRSRRSKKFRSRKWSNRVDDVERKTSSGSLISDRTRSSFTTLGMYKGKLVTIKLTNRKKIDLTRNLQMELKHMRDITHEHLTRFEGACIDPPRICVLTEYCPKGSLRDILLNEEIQLDWMFKFSLMNDLVKGMSFLHGSAINSHGNLKSTNCVVDSRFVLKITDYGLGAFRSVPSYDDYDRYYAKKLWTAPELLRMAAPPPKGTQKGDVYSFGIILHEIALRKGTFYTDGVNLSAKEIVRSVRNGYFPYFRPTVDYESLSEGFSNLLQRSWNEDPSERLDFSELKDIIKRFNKGNPGNLLDSLLSRMEQYATNLEGLVEERTAAYLEEKRKADDLLYQMLPVPVVDRLKRGDAIPAEAYESVTIFFSDIVGFTQLSATSTPMEVVDMLNDLYTCFDAIIDNFDVYKVETIGDAYMLVSGLPVRNGIKHAAEIARTSLALLRTVNNFQIRHRPNDQLKLRIGIHSGPCCAGVVGLKMPRYCLFGDTVNTASRMESHGLPLLIHVSHPTKLLLDRYGSFHLELRGETEMKGKGSMTTYWLLGENPLTEMPSAEENESQV